MNSASDLATAIMRNTEDLHNNAIDFPTFSARAYALWDDVNARRLSEKVRSILWTRHCDKVRV
tara:strand:+ start:4277 stop:4465 length:189 start_codon:yes stop_codon:yes gene_type:complete